MSENRFSEILSEAKELTDEINVYEKEMREIAELPVIISEGAELDALPDFIDYSEDEIIQSILPRENGCWSGEPGNSIWYPDGDYTPPEKGKEKPYSNPENLPWDEILEKYGIKGIPFKDGEPDFSEVSKGTVEVEDFSTDRDANFTKADIELAKQWGCTPDEVKDWRKENGCVWHECKDMKTMHLVPHEIHANIAHSGGISEAKKGNGE